MRQTTQRGSSRSTRALGRCQVAHESFENPDIARLMNEHFINNKVDRQERPDLDDIYQKVVQMTGQGGGWPLTVFVKPQGDPFFGGTYFPPEERCGRQSISIVVAGDRDEDGPLVEAVYRSYQPAAYVCRKRSCDAPVTSAQALLEYCAT